MWEEVSIFCASVLLNTKVEELAYSRIHFRKILLKGLLLATERLGVY